jgi:hypothetical protein
MIPNLEYSYNKGIVKYRYTNIVAGFRMPIRLLFGETFEWVAPSAEWQTKSIDGDLSNLQVDKNFYIKALETN